MSATYWLMLLGVLAIFGAILVSFLAFGEFSNEPRGTKKSLQVMKSFTTMPQARVVEEEKEASFTERVFAPLLARFQKFARKFTPSDHNERIHKRLEVAGSPADWNTERVTSLKFVGLIVAPLLMVVFCLSLGMGFAPTLVLTIGAGAAGYMGPNMYLYQLGYNRTEQISRDMPDALDLLTISVESGLGFEAALAQVARNTEGPLAEEFARVLQEMQLGMGRGAALRALADRTNVGELKSFVSSMVQADALGIPIAKVLRVQSREIRIKRRQAAEEAAQKVAVKILIPLVFCILPCLFIAVLGPAAINIIGALT